MRQQASIPFGFIAWVTFTLILAAYFIFAAIQGDYGLLRRSELQGDYQSMEQELVQITVHVERLENLTNRLSDRYLDLDLLDQQARDVLGLVRSDEIVVR